MDALAGYGSDTSSDEEEEEATKQQQPKSNSLSALLGNDSDSSHDGNASVEKAPPAKRQKKEEEESVTKQSPLLDPPTTSTSGPSVIHLGIDYLSKTETYNNNEVPKNNNNNMSDKLKNLASSLKVASWADHLKTQTEFHNPRFFESVVEHFQIKEPLGSQAKFRNSGLADYDRKIFNNQQS